MKRIIAICLSLIVGVSFGNSQRTQEKPSFSGIWEFDDSKSVLYIGGHEVGVWPPRGDPKGCKSKLEIEHADPKLSIRAFSCEGGATGQYLPVRTYYTDGRGEFHDRSDGTRFETKTEWDRDNNLVITYYVEKNGKKRREWVRTLKIAKDLQRLTEKSTASGPDDPDSFTRQVYKRAK